MIELVKMLSMKIKLKAIMNYVGKILILSLRHKNLNNRNSCEEIVQKIKH
jgi:hypothetical protein